MRTIPLRSCAAAFTLILCNASAMDLVWSRGTGQTRCEATPALVDIDRDGALELLTVNVWGQVMLWGLDGSDKGPGQDGTVAELPKDEWSSMPVVVDTPAGARTVVGNGSGLLVCLDSAFKTLWTYQLPGKTQWSRAVPAVFDAGGETCLAIGDLSGAVTCLDLDGNTHWTCTFKDAPVRTYVSAASVNGASVLFAAAGEKVHCLGADGAERWSFDMGGAMLAKPEPIAIDSALRVICANANGDVVALDPGGKELWRAQTGGDIDASIVHWDDAARPLIACTGLWGDAIALDMDGKPVWRHAFRSKNRARPLVADADGDGVPELIAAAYNQHLYAFDRDGRCTDDVRVSGSVNASPIAVPNGRGGQDIIVVSTALQAHRFTPGAPKSVYDASAAARGRVRVEAADALAGAPGAVIVDNPAGRFVRVNVSARSTSGRTVFSRLSAADTIVLPTPSILRGDVNAAPFNVEISGAKGDLLLERMLRAKAAAQHAERMAVWAAPAYAPFDADAAPGDDAPGRLTIGPVYQGETDQGAFVVRNAGPETLHAQIVLDTPARGDGVPFGGPLRFLGMLAVPTMNGEQVFDALEPMNNRRLSVPPRGAAKVWVHVDTHGAAPGVYRGRLRVESTTGETIGTLKLAIDADALRLPDAALALCTWDYVPNKWFPENTTAAVLDDMQRHGVNVFPRSCAPKATYDGARLTIDWAPLDEELARLEGRGTLLLHVAEPAIEFGANAPADRRAVHIEYLRALRDHLFAKGRPYETWALYPIDEPGLDYGGNAQRQVEAGQLFREADPRMRIYTDPVPGLSQRDYDRIAPYVDIWAPNMRLVSGLLVNDARMTAIRNSGKPVWSYECVSQVRSLSPLRYNRAGAWRADFFGLDGIGFWTHSTTQLDPWTSDPDKNDEYALVYPGAAPVSSVRWEAVRDGIEDVGAICALEDAIKTARVKDPRARAIARAGDVLRRARTGVMEMADEAYVESRDFLEKGGRQIQHTRWDAAAFARYRVEIAAATHALIDD